MKLNGQQRTILREGILGAYPSEDELKILLLEKMNLNLEEFNRGEIYNTKISNLIIQLEVDGKLKNFIRIIVKEKSNSPFLDKVKSEFKTAIEDDNQISKTNNFIATTTDTGICPYKGLRYFDCNEEDSKYFHGRENLTDQLLDKVRKSNFIAIVGPSGSGKSSVMRAGLLHQLKRGEKLLGSGNWKVKILVPGEDPLESLALTFIDPELSEIAAAKELKEGVKLLENSELELLIKACKSPKVVIVIDQFEEVFTLCEDVGKREQFLSCLLEAAEKLKAKLCLVLAMRADFLGKCLEREYSGLGKKIQENLICVIPMNRKQLQKAIALPAKKVSLEVEEELIQRMLNEIEGSPGSLPLLEYTLTRLWEERSDNQLKLTTYQNMGGIGGTLDSRATEVYEQFSPEEQQIAKLIFLNLTQLGEGTEDTRRRVKKSELMTEKHDQAAIEKVIQKLADEKLIVTSENNVIDVAHEALIRHWKQLRKWLEENRDALGRQRKIEEEAKYWVEKEKDKEYLWRGTRLEEAVEILKEYAATVTLSSLATEFLQASSREQLITYLGKPEIDNLNQEGIEKGATRRSYLSKERLRELLEDETERTGAGLAASWLLEQWGEKMPVRTAEVDKQGNIQLRIVEKLPQIVVEELEEGIILEMVEVLGGEFMMGSPEEEEEGKWWERPTHKVKISPFLIGKYPITREQWRLVATLPKVELDLKADPSTYGEEGVPESIINRYPVTTFTWYEAVEFCKRLSRLSGQKGKGYQYRLPSEAQWEYACRAGTETPYHWGQKITPALGNYIKKSLARPTPVGRFQVANAFGLCDVHGNVWEWCEDLWHNTYDGATEDGRAWLNDNNNDDRLLRGGSFVSNSAYCRSAFRNNNDPDNRFNTVGVRVVAVPWT
jgi:formylglycine-generating enzyme required for sulfatase activity/energy-coupling factor transporter ATP-binding protein EcfA2